MLDISMIKFDEKGLVPAVVQEENGQVLMLAYMNKESLEKTLETGRLSTAYAGPDPENYLFIFRNGRS